MRRRLYFMVPDTFSTRQIRDELLLAQIENSHIHVMAKDGIPLAGLHEASILQKSDFVHGAETGLAVGAVSHHCRAGGGVFPACGRRPATSHHSAHRAYRRRVWRLGRQHGCQLDSQLAAEKL